ncbi:unnamed protein product [Lota lota]
MKSERMERIRAPLRSRPGSACSAGWKELCTIPAPRVCRSSAQTDRDEACCLSLRGVSRSGGTGAPRVKSAAWPDGGAPRTRLSMNVCECEIRTRVQKGSELSPEAAEPKVFQRTVSVQLAAGLGGTTSTLRTALFGRWTTRSPTSDKRVAGFSKRASPHNPQFVRDATRVASGKESTGKRGGGGVSSVRSNVQRGLAVTATNLDQKGPGTSGGSTVCYLTLVPKAPPPHRRWGSAGPTTIFSSEDMNV